MEITPIDVLIVGSGPSGTSTALHLVKKNPAWAGRIIVVDKAIHPREKLCGGGITHMGQNVLTHLGLPFEPRNFEVKEVRMVYRDKSYSFFGNPVFRVVRRSEFDHWLVKKAAERGITVRQGETVKEVKPLDDGVQVVTDQAIYQANVLVAADGSRSFVRRALKWDDDSRVARLLEVLTPEDPRTQTEFRERVAVFDFTQMDHGLQGYYWDFPSYVNGKPMMNRGVFDSRAQPERPKADLPGELREAMSQRQRNLDEYELKGHPIRWWDKNGRFSIPHIILVGDAAGADPFMGEGISFALGYGEIAAETIEDAFTRQDFTFATYREHLLNHYLFKQMSVRVWLARLAYKPHASWFVRLGWHITKWFIKFTAWRDPNYVPAEPLRINSEPHVVNS